MPPSPAQMAAMKADMVPHGIQLLSDKRVQVWYMRGTELRHVFGVIESLGQIVTVKLDSGMLHCIFASTVTDIEEQALQMVGPKLVMPH